MNPCEPFNSQAAQFRRQCLDLAARRHRMPIATGLLLREQPDPDAIRRDGARLGAVIVAAAKRHGTPLAMPLMDLRVEKRDLLRRLGVPVADLDTFHFHEPLDRATRERARDTLDMPLDPLMRAQVDALRHVTENSDRTPIGMVIGPFSLMVKLMRNPVVAVARASRAPSHGHVVLAMRVLELAADEVLRSIRAQAAAGARALCVCEPAANTAYVSPNQLEGPDNPFEKFVMAPNERIGRESAALDVALVFHNCGELIDSFVAAFGRRLRPAMLSLGSTRKLWEDAAHVPDDVVLYGNLPTKHFHDDAQLPPEQVEALTCDLLERMAATTHPFILGSECDVVSVPGSHDRIVHKVARMLTCACG